MKKTNRGDLILGAIIFLTVMMVLIGSIIILFERNEVGYAKIEQTPSGKVKVHMLPGYFWCGFSKLTTWRTANDTIEFAGPTAIPIRFRDGGQATVAMDVTFKLKEEETNLTRLHKDWHTYEQLMAGLIRPQINNVVQLTATKLSAEDSYTKKDAFIYQIHDQLVNGIYEYVQIVQPNGQVNFKLKFHGEGEDQIIERQENPFDTYNLQVTKVTVRDVQYAKAIEDTLAAKQEAIEAEAQGKKTLAIAVAEEKAKTASAEEQLKRAKLEAEAVRVSADAEAHKRKKLAEANNSLDARLDAFIQVNDSWAKSTAVPPVVFSGNGKGQDPVYSLMMIKLMSEQMGVQPPAKAK